MAKRRQGAGSRKGGRKPDKAYEDVGELRLAVYQRAVAIFEKRWPVFPVAEVRPYVLALYERMRESYDAHRRLDRLLLAVWCCLGAEPPRKGAPPASRAWSLAELRPRLDELEKELRRLTTFVYDENDLEPWGTVAELCFRSPWSEHALSWATFWAMFVGPRASGPAPTDRELAAASILVEPNFEMPLAGRNSKVGQVLARRRRMFREATKDWRQIIRAGRPPPSAWWWDGT